MPYGQYNRADAGERQNAFYYDLAAFDPSLLKPLPDMSHEIDHYGGEDDLPSLSPGFYMEPTIFSRVVEMLDDSNARFVIKDDLKIGRDDSRHQVFFGDIILDAAHSSRSLEVAVKSTAATEKELAMYQFVRQLGMKTFHPVGFMVMPNGRKHLLTSVMRGVKSIDSYDWALFDTDEKWDTTGAAVDTMVGFHTELLMSKDLAFRNVVTGDYREVIYADLELSVSMRGVGDEIIDLMHSTVPEVVKDRDICINAIAKIMGQDFTDVINSIRTHVFKNLPASEKPQTTMAEFKQLKRHIYGPYEQLLLSLDKSTTPYVPIVLAAFRRLKKERTELASKGIT